MLSCHCYLLKAYCEADCCWPLLTAGLCPPFPAALPSLAVPQCLKVDLSPAADVSLVASLPAVQLPADQHVRVVPIWPSALPVLAELQHMPLQVALTLFPAWPVAADQLLPAAALCHLGLVLLWAAAPPSSAALWVTDAHLSAAADLPLAAADLPLAAADLPLAAALALTRADLHETDTAPLFAVAWLLIDSVLLPAVAGLLY